MFPDIPHSTLGIAQESEGSLALASLLAHPPPLLLVFRRAGPWLGHPYNFNFIFSAEKILVRRKDSAQLSHPTK